MPNPSIDFNIFEIARDFLFVEDTEFYPVEIWEDFEEALYLFLTDDEIEVLNYRYGDKDFCTFSVENRRRILSDLILRFNRSEFYSEMDATMKAFESELFSLGGDLPIADNRSDSTDYVRSALTKLGLNYQPGSLGNFSFDSQIGNFPVYVWRHNEVAMPLSILLDLLDKSVVAGFGRLFIVAPPLLTADLPVSIPGCIPHTFIPLLAESQDQRSGRSDQLFTM